MSGIHCLGNSDDCTVHHKLCHKAAPLNKTYKDNNQSLFCPLSTEPMYIVDFIDLSYELTEASATRNFDYYYAFIRERDSYKLDYTTNAEPVSDALGISRLKIYADAAVNDVVCFVLFCCCL